LELGAGVTRLFTVFAVAGGGAGLNICCGIQHKLPAGGLVQVRLRVVKLEYYRFGAGCWGY
jgi:hypothetical protein